MPDPIFTEAQAAVATLKALGYTYHGGEVWKPPLGKPIGKMVEVPLNIIRHWPDGMPEALEKLWKDSLGAIPSCKLQDLQRLLAQFGFTMRLYEWPASVIPEPVAVPAPAALPISSQDQVNLIAEELKSMKTILAEVFLHGAPIRASKAP